MADTAFQTMYRQEHIAGFEQRQSLLRGTCTTQTETRGNSVVFLVAGSGDDEAVTRGTNGLIAPNSDDLTQVTCTLEEWHDLRRRTGFNIFASQGDGRRIMQENTMAVMNRKIDSQIIAQLNTATNDTGAAQTANLKLVMKSLAILGNNSVPIDGRISAVVSPSFLAYLMMAEEFSSAEYISRKPLEGADPMWKDQPGFYRWMGINWISHPKVPGVGTAAEKCFMYHASAIGHAAPTELLTTAVGYDEEQDYSFARCSAYMNAKLLQNEGVVVMNHDGSEFVAS